MFHDNLGMSTSWSIKTSWIAVFIVFIQILSEYNSTVLTCIIYLLYFRATHNLYQLVMRHQKSHHEELELEDTNSQLVQVPLLIY